MKLVTLVTNTISPRWRVSSEKLQAPAVCPACQLGFQPLHFVSWPGLADRGTIQSSFCERQIMCPQLLLCFTGVPPLHTHPWHYFPTKGCQAINHQVSWCQLSPTCPWRPRARSREKIVPQFCMFSASSRTVLPRCLKNISPFLHFMKYLLHY